MKTFVQYGAGNIGRGFIGPLFAAAGYHVTYIDINQTLINSINERGSYPVEIVSDRGGVETLVQSISGVDGADDEAVAGAIVGASVMATAVGVNILPKIAKNIAMGLSLRWRLGYAEPLNILLCENLLDADRITRGLLLENLSAAEKPLLNARVGLVETSIGRMVPLMTKERQKGDLLRVCVEPYAFLPVDKAAFRGEIPSVPGLIPCEPFEFYQRRKLFLHNMGHAFAAYGGRLSGHTTLAKAIAAPAAKLLVQRAMLESARALSRAFAVSLEEILPHIDDLLLRFGNSALGDTVDRVGRDTRRKLSKDDRFAGAARAAEEQGVPPVYIAAGLACGLFFRGTNDEGSAYVQALLDEHGAPFLLEHHCGFSPDSMAFRLALAAYRRLSSGCDLDGLLSHCEEEVRRLLCETPVL